MKKYPSFNELRSISKIDRGDPVYEFIDYLAVFPALLFIRTKLTANQISLIWIIGQIPFSIMLTTGNYWSMLLGIIGFHFMFILDCTDGIIARYRKQFSINGIYLDYLGHYINNPLLFFCLGIGVARSSNNIIYLGLGIFIASIFLFNKAISINPSWYNNLEQKSKIEKSFSDTLLKNKKGLIRWIFTIFRIEYLGNVIFWCILFNKASLILIIYALLFLVETIRKVINQLILNYKTDNL